MPFKKRPMKTSNKNERNSSENTFVFWLKSNSAYNNCICDNEMQKWQSKGWHCDIGKVHIFWEGHKILRNFHITFVLCSASPK